MKIVTCNPEAQMFEQVETLGHQPREGWYCIYFKSLVTDGRSASLTGKGSVDELLTKASGTLYHFDNGDNFILLRGAPDGVEAKLSHYLWVQQSGEASANPGYNLFTTLDLTRDWAGFYKLCETRYLRALAMSYPPQSEMLRAANSAPSFAPQDAA